MESNAKAHIILKTPRDIREIAAQALAETFSLGTGINFMHTLCLNGSIISSGTPFEVMGEAGGQIAHLIDCQPAEGTIGCFRWKISDSFFAARTVLGIVTSMREKHQDLAQKAKETLAFHETAQHQYSRFEDFASKQPKQP